MVILARLEKLNSQLKHIGKDLEDLSEDISEPLSNVLTDIEKEIILTKNEFIIIKRATTAFRENIIPKYIIPFGQAIEHFGAVIKDFLDVRRTSEETYGNLIEWTEEMNNQVTLLKNILKDQDKEINSARALLRKEIKFNANEIKEIKEIMESTDKLLKDLNTARHNISLIFNEITNRIPKEIAWGAHEEAEKYRKEEKKQLSTPKFWLGTYNPSPKQPTKKWGIKFRPR